MERQAASVASNSTAASQKLNFTVSDVPYSSAEYKKIIQTFAPIIR
ncbi:hypothetical protein [Paenibacillus sp. sgz5001063]